MTSGTRQVACLFVYDSLLPFHYIFSRPYFALSSDLIRLILSSVHEEKKGKKRKNFSTLALDSALLPLLLQSETAISGGGGGGSGRGGGGGGPRIPAIRPNRYSYHYSWPIDNKPPQPSWPTQRQQHHQSQVLERVRDGPTARIDLPQTTKAMPVIAVLSCGIGRSRQSMIRCLAYDTLQLTQTAKWQ